MGGLGFGELMVILLIALVLFGAGKLPQVGDSLGRAIRGFKRASSGVEEQKEELKRELDQAASEAQRTPDAK